MNIFKKTLEEIQANNESLVEFFEILPGVPDKLSLKDTAYILDVSIQTIERMVETGDLPLTQDGYIQKSELERYFPCHTLADIPVLDDTQITENPSKSRYIQDKK